MKKRLAIYTHTLFYLDPPYYGCEQLYGKGLFERDDFQRLASQLSTINGRFILSLNDHPGNRGTPYLFSLCKQKSPEIGGHLSPEIGGHLTYFPCASKRELISLNRNRGVREALGGVWEAIVYCPCGIRHTGGVNLEQAFVWNMGTCRLDDKAKANAAAPQR